MIDITMDMDNIDIGIEINHCHILCCLLSSQHLAPHDLQSEIDTHLSLLHIALTSNYNSASGTGNALDTMRSIYASQGFGYYPGIDCKKSTCSYHFPFGIVPHFCFVPLLSVHHALLSNNLGGGIAYLGVLCDSNYGFGLVSLSPALLLLFVLHQYFSMANHIHFFSFNMNRRVQVCPVTLLVCRTR